MITDRIGLHLVIIHHYLFACLVECFSIECLYSKTKVIITGQSKYRKFYKEPMRAQIKIKQATWGIWALQLIGWESGATLVGQSRSELNQN